MKRKYRFLILALFVAVLGFGIAVFSPAASQAKERLYTWGDAQLDKWFTAYVLWDEENRALPETGVYYCQELEAAIILDGATTIRYSYGTEETLYRPFHSASFESQDDRVEAVYRWDREENVLELTFLRFPGKFQKRKVYRFEKAE